MLVLRRMKPYIVFFMILKIAVFIQFFLVLTNKESTDSLVYIITDVLFKVSIFLFIEYILFYKGVNDLAFEDKMIISFSGGLLLYDVWMNDVPKLITELKNRGYNL